jgi:xanthine dehydrogenase YagS FAD-binding subunit
MITAIVVPKTVLGKRSTYHKICDRESLAFALTSAAVALEMDGGKVKQVRIALGGVATRPSRATTAELWLAGQMLTPDTALAAGRAAFAGAKAGRDNGFKIDLGARTVADALLIAAGRTSA